MRLHSILDLFRADNWSSKLVDQIVEMLETTSEMFGYCVAVIVYGEPDSDPQAQIYDRDLKVHELQQDIRRRVLSRLSLQSSRGEVPTALIFVNAVKDVERIGDYMKNLHEVLELMPENVDRKMYQEHLVGRSRTIEDLFARTSQAFRESDREKAQDVIKRSRVLGTQAEQLIRELTASDLSTADAVSLVLILRFYKRIAAHMCNIATSVVMPVDRLDFYDEPGA